MEGSTITAHESSLNFSTIQPGTLDKTLNFVYSAFTKIRDLGLWENRCFRITLVVTAILLLLGGIVAGIVLHSSVGSKVLPLISLQVAGVMKLLTSSLQSGGITLGGLQSCAKILGSAVKDTPKEPAVENPPADKTVENAPVDKTIEKGDSCNDPGSKTEGEVKSDQVSNPSTTVINSEKGTASDVKSGDSVVTKNPEDTTAKHKKKTGEKKTVVKNEGITEEAPGKVVEEKKGKKGKKG